MRTKLVASLAALTLVAVACGDDGETVGDDGDTVTDDAGGDAADAAPEQSGDGPVQVGSTELGDVLVDQDGMTLYAFEPDSEGVPTCEDDCLAAWPPLLVESEELPDGLDSAVFSVVEAPDGSFQVAAGGWPLYRFASDAEPGDVAGHLVDGFGGLWWAVTPDGEPILGDEAGADDGQADDGEAPAAEEEDDDRSDSGSGY